MTHGRLSTYANGLCRCEVCRAAWRAYMQRHRAVRVALKRCVSCNQRVTTLTRCQRCNARMLAGLKARKPSLFQSSEVN